MSVPGPVVSVHQPCYYPWLGLVDKIARSDIFIVLDTVQINKRAFQHRTRVRGPRGWQYLTVPVLAKGHQEAGLPLCEVRTDPTSQFERKHLEAFRHNYARAKYWDRHRPFLEDTYSRRWELLLDLDMATLRYTLETLQIEPRIVLASDLEADGAKSDLILDLCRAVGAGTYLSGTGARAYLDEPAFLEAGIPVRYQEFRHPVYPQGEQEFLEGLGGIDLLLHCGPESRGYLEARP